MRGEAKAAAGGFDGVGGEGSLAERGGAEWIDGSAEARFEGAREQQGGSGGRRVREGRLELREGEGLRSGTGRVTRCDGVLERLGGGAWVSKLVGASKPEGGEPGIVLATAAGGVATAELEAGSRLAGFRAGADELEEVALGPRLALLRRLAPEGEVLAGVVLREPTGTPKKSE